jgi:hypothetical protein
MRRIQSRRVIHYGLAIGMTLLALVITLALLPWNDRMVGAFFYLAVLMSARYSGIRPAIISQIIFLNFAFSILFRLVSSL